MKPNSPIKILIFFIITAVSVFAASKGVSPANVTAGNNVRIYLNGDKALPSEYDIRFSINNSKIVQMHNNQRQYWYYNLSTKSGEEGTYTVHYYLYKNSAQHKDLGISSFTVSAPTPTFNSGVAIYDTSGGFSLRWNSASGSVSRYELYRSTSRGNLGSRIYSGYATSYTDTGLSYGTTYYYTAKACNSSECTQGAQDYKKYSKTTPTITSISIDKTAGYSGDSFTFRVNLSGSLPSGYHAYIDFGSNNGWLSQNQAGGHAKMDNHGSYWSLSTPINSISTNKFRVGIFDSAEKLVGSYSSAKYFTVKQKPETQYAPNVSINSGNSAVLQGSTYSVTLNFSDKNNDLKNAFINWGDSTANNSVELSGGSSTKTFTHIYHKIGSFTWKVIVHDHRDVPASTQKTVTVNDKPVNNTPILNLLNKDSLIQKMNLSTHLTEAISRSDAVVLIDRMRAAVKSGIDKNMKGYYNPFVDVPDDAEYLPSMMRLAYYRSKSFDGNPINKYNTLFNPMRQMTREEFLAVALTSFDIPKKDFDLSKFTDKTNMSDWAIKYFKTAVAWDIISGNKDRLLARDPIRIQEALWILEGISKKFSSSYPFDINSYDAPESLDLSQIYNKEIGFEYEPRYYKSDAKPINISKIDSTKKSNYYILTASSTIDNNNGASDYYWWTTDKGYFKQVPGSDNYKTVYFYPMSSKPISDYHITVHGGDNLGYVDSSKLTIPAENFSYPEDLRAKDVLPVITNQLKNVQIDNFLVANKFFDINLSNVSVKKSNIDLGVDQVVVTMTYKDNGVDKIYELFHGTPIDKKARFIVDDYRELYGKPVKLQIELYSQAKKYTVSKTLTYIPLFTVKGKIYNARGGIKISSVIIDGKSVTLDENGEFYYRVDSTKEVKQLEVQTKENSQQNHFDPIKVDLTYDSPSRYIVLVGQDTRPSLNSTISPIRVPSNKSVNFTLTSNTVIPSNAKIQLEDSSCGVPKGLGTKKVEITCTTANTDSIKYALMTIKSVALYGDGLSKTIVIDKVLNDANATDIVKNIKEQLFVPSYSSKDIDLPVEMLGVTISWDSSNPAVISTTGKVTQQNSEENVILTATLSKDGKQDTKEFIVTVPGKKVILDSDGDGISDTIDAFPNDPAASKDSDGDGYPDEWNAGYTQAQSTSDPKLELDAYPKNPEKWRDISIKPIDDLYLDPYSQDISPITIEVACGENTDLHYNAESSNKDFIDVYIDDTNKLFIDLKGQMGEEGNATVVVTVRTDTYSQSTSFFVNVKHSEVLVEDESTNRYIPILLGEYEFDTGDYKISAKIKDNRFLYYSYKRTGKDTAISVNIPGADIKIAKDMNATITLPTKEDISIFTTTNGELIPYIKDAVLPKDPLPLGTNLDANDTKIKFLVPIPKVLEFIKRK